MGRCSISGASVLPEGGLLGKFEEADLGSSCPYETFLEGKVRIGERIKIKNVTSVLEECARILNLVRSS